MNAGYLWRKYECGVKVFSCTREDMAVDTPRRILWPSAITNEFPKAPRWEGMGGAFIGFVSYGLEQPHACVYDVKRLYKLIRDGRLAKAWISGSDSAEAYEYLVSHFAGIWMGNHTPYLWTAGPDLLLEALS